jgi:hypothetical protein
VHYVHVANKELQRYIGHVSYIFPPPPQGVIGKGESPSVDATRGYVARAVKEGNISSAHELTKFIKKSKKIHTCSFHPIPYVYKILS